MSMFELLHEVSIALWSKSMCMATEIKRLPWGA